MALRLGALYDALRSANIPEAEARAAAEEVAGYESRLSDLAADLRLLKWMVGAVITFVLLNLAVTLNVLSRLPQP
jgi:hypothetical protein